MTAPHALDEVEAVMARHQPNPAAVTDPAATAAIQARIAYARLPFWQRWTTRAPKGWRR